MKQFLFFSWACVVVLLDGGPIRASTHLPTEGGPYKVIAADFTGDGVIDLAVSYYRAGVVAIEKGDGRGNFAHLALNPICEDCDPSYEGGIYNIAHADIDKDGLPDLAVGCDSRFVVIAKNLGEGKFQRMQVFQTQSAAKGVRWADLDNDGELDLLYAARGTGRPGDTDEGELSLRQGLGNWKFGPEIKLDAGISAYYIETGDLNNDGYVDILVPNELGTTVSYWMNPGKTVFDAAEPMQRQVLATSGVKVNDVRAVDFNGDGHLDVLTANWISSDVSLFPGKGDGTFGKEQLMPGGRNCVFFAVGDFDHDQDQDFVVTHWTGDFASVFLNRGDGRFAPRVDYKTGHGNYGVDVLDADGDGNLDVVTANFTNHTLSLLKGSGDGTFQSALTAKKGVQKNNGSWSIESMSAFDGIGLDRVDAIYQSGEEAVFSIQLAGRPENVEVCLSNDGYKLVRQHPLVLRDGKATIRGSLREPGFLRCRVNYDRDGKRGVLLRTAAFDPYEVQPTTTEPEDFDQFWDTQKEALAKIPWDVQLEEVSRLSEGKPYRFYDISLANIDDSRVNGYLAKPTEGSGPFPAILSLQNHGGGAWSVPPSWVTRFAEKGFVAMAINTHDVENGRDREYYAALNQGPLASYTLRGFMDRDTYYFKSVYLRIVRAIDYLTSLPEWDGKTLLLTGRSQGGGLSVVGAGLDQRVTGIVCAVPALCEHGGHKFGRAAGWPRFVPTDEHDYGSDLNAPTANGHGPVSETVFQVSRYYDAVNFARKIQCPVVINLGMIDRAVPPTSVFSAYNVIGSKKTAILSRDRGHSADQDPEYRRDERILGMAAQAGSRVVVSPKDYGKKTD